MEGIPYEYVVHVPSLPRFATFIFPDYEFFPDQAKHVGITLIKGELRNKYSSISFQFKVNVTNSAPFFAEKIPEQFFVPIYTTQTYQLPEVFDREGQEIIISAREEKKQKLPGFVKLNTITKEFTFSPFSLDTKEEYSIQLDVQDTFGTMNSYKFSVKLKSSNSKKENLVQILGMNIEKVTRDSQVTLKFYSLEKQSKDIKDIVILLQKSSFEITITQQQGI